MTEGNSDAVLREGIRAFKRGQYKTALPLLEKCATEGSLEAQRLLSRMYFAGNGVKANKERYFYWLLRAAENGDVAAKSKIKRRFNAGELPASLGQDPYLLKLMRGTPGNQE